MSIQHTTETTKYECTICDGYFARKANAIKHITKQHQLEKDQDTYIKEKTKSNKYNPKELATIPLIKDIKKKPLHVPEPSILD